MKIFLTLLFFISFHAQAQVQNNERITVFLDCYCDINYIKSEINFVDYTRDNEDADVYIQVLQQGNGGGGNQYQLIFIGNNNFVSQSDTLRYNTKPNSTNYENRQLLVKYLALGLVPFINQTKSIENITVKIKENAANDSLSESIPKRDPWNYYVFSIGVNGFVNADQVYRSVQYSGNISATRITDNWKVAFNLSFGRSRTIYEFDNATAGTTTKIEVKNVNYDFSHKIVKSLSPHWSAGYYFDALKSTFYNYNFRSLLRPGIEYNVYPYKVASNKLFTIRYGVDYTYNKYFDTTFYNKTHEDLLGQSLNANLTLNQKWGNTNLSADYHQYFTSGNLYNISVGGGVNLRVTGSLFFNVSILGSIVRDQIYLPKGQATQQEILTRQRQLATNYTYYTQMGVSYRFGSKINNYVNVRFD